LLADDAQVHSQRFGQEESSVAFAQDWYWQNHSIRGFISGTVSKKMGCVVQSAKNESGERSYRIGE